MKPMKISGDAVYLVPATDDAFRVGVLPGEDGGIATALHIETESLGRFIVPLGAYQLGVIAGVANWLLKLDAEQVTELRARMTRYLNEGETE